MVLKNILVFTKVFPAPLPYKTYILPIAFLQPQQIEIWRRVIPGSRFSEWQELGVNYTTQKPAVLCGIGPAGESLSRIASLIHNAGNGAGQSGFGAVWGSKRLKAISIIGTGGVKVADPNALMTARLWYRQFQYNVDNPRMEKPPEIMIYSPVNNAPGSDNFANIMLPLEPARAQACAGCPKGCRQRLAGVSVMNRVARNRHLE